MKVEEVIKRVYDLQQKLSDVGGLSDEYQLYVLTDGCGWVVKFLELDLVSSEEYDEHSIHTLENSILYEMEKVKDYLNLVLKYRGM